MPTPPPTDFSPSARWCWHPDDPLYRPGFMLFRRAFTVTESSATLRVQVTADHRYTLYLDGECVGRGPCRSDVQHYRYETYEQALPPGRHVIAARVAIFPAHGDNGETWQAIAEMHHGGGWLVGGGVYAGDTLIESLETADGWRCRPDAARAHRSVMAENDARHTVVPAMETYDAELEASNWLTPVGALDGWTEARALWHAVARPIAGDPYARWWLMPREIPMMRTTPQPIAHSMQLPLTVPAGTEAIVTIDVGHLTTAFPRITTQGPGGRIRMRYSESLYTDGKKLDRASGVVAGYSDLVLTGATAVAYEPFWFRTFRFIELRVTAGPDAPVTITDFALDAWMYPFNLRATFSVPSDPAVATIWEVAWRTATLCAHEHYEDCPYYEQLQYVGDTRIQALVSYWATGDSRLARQSIRQFDWSRIPEGLTQSRYPSNWMQVIPGFSLYWVLMIDDYFRVHGDRAFLREHIHGIRGVLDWFERRRLPDGLVGPLAFWGFHDWVTGWPHGSPGRDTGEPVTLDSLLYAEACRVASDLFREAGAPEREVQELAVRHASLVRAVNARCFDVTRLLYVDIPGTTHASQHTNIWAILSGAVTGDKARALLHAIVERDDLSPATLYYLFYLFRAMERTDCYDLFWPQLTKWKDVLRWNFTTFPEIPSPDTRSDCHAWSAAPIYEFLACVLGVQPGEPGFRSLLLRPHPGPLPCAEGHACAGGQRVHVHWEVRPNTRLRLAFELERPLPVTIQWPDGSRQDLGVQQAGEYEGGM